jgi:hypothetical protein
MSSPRLTRMDTKTGSTEGLTNRAVKHSNLGTSLLCVSTAGREAGSSESASAFINSNEGSRKRRAAFRPAVGTRKPNTRHKSARPKKETCRFGETLVWRCYPRRGEIMFPYQ